MRARSEVLWVLELSVMMILSVRGTAGLGAAAGGQGGKALDRSKKAVCRLMFKKGFSHQPGGLEVQQRTGKEWCDEPRLISCRKRVDLMRNRCGSVQAKCPVHRNRQHREKQRGKTDRADPNIMHL